ncbi:MAG: SGNH/GDSL hydrolase family protein [Candidatus Promineifilaceae bacterium]
MRSPDNRFRRYPKLTLLIVNLVVIIGMIFAAEQILRRRSPTFLRRVATNARLVPLRENPPNSIWFIEPYGIEIADSLERKPYRFEIDSNGFVAPSKLHESPDHTLVFMGGSTTETILVDEKSRFPYLVGRLLETEGFTVNSYNAGRAANNSHHSLNLLLNKVLALKPDRVILMHNVNDLGVQIGRQPYAETNRLVTPNLSTGEHLRRARSSWIATRLPAISQAITAYQQRGTFQQRDAALGASVAGETTQFTPEETAAMRGRFAAHLQTFIAICQAQGIEPILMTQPNRITQVPDPLFEQIIHHTFRLSYDDYFALYTQFNETIRDVSAENDLRLIDLAAEIPQNDQYIYDWVHLNTAGSELAAEIIADALR